MHKLFLPVLLVFLGCLVLSCDSNRVYDEYQTIPSTWNKDSIVTFNLKTIDSVKPYNVFINIRNNSDFDYSNLFLIAQIKFPQGKVITDTLEYEMAAPNGEWLGTGFGDVKESKLWYKQNVIFEETGNYKFSLQQAMRKNGNVEGIENLEGITEVGFRIEDIQN
ncbi:gliding motility-associated lipoprotein GldH [Gillisia sp. Hel1_33_143]|uniref:gliding motility lipoprotein GldH n=1 Tax=Gillisia sp. Hel1_33_143 TaxID=1336796 RepID=UPI00087B7255|nr:gliding motility lipoprotein GldH [Gillisia sp. Hel1_33_143]SDR83531.1 gliding motility-associated lipoprotein GldH [Gillisia sp. Hel1_33_143]